MSGQTEVMLPHAQFVPLRLDLDDALSSQMACRACLQLTGISRPGLECLLKICGRAAGGDHALASCLIVLAEMNAVNQWRGPGAVLL